MTWSSFNHLEAVAVDAMVYVCFSVGLLAALVAITAGHYRPGSVSGRSAANGAGHRR